MYYGVVGVAVAAWFTMVSGCRIGILIQCLFITRCHWQRVILVLSSFSTYVLYEPFYLFEGFRAKTG